MNNLAYLKKTLSRGDFWIKIVKTGRLLKFSIYRFTGKRVGEYPAPPKNIQEIGFFDRQLLVHTGDEHKKYFKETNLYTDGDYKMMEHKLVSLVLYEDLVLIKKRFEDFKRVYEFFNELFCLHQLRKTGLVPMIYFVDYKELTIYMEYIGGDVMVPIKNVDKEIASTVGFREIKNGFQKALQKMHDNDIVLYDMAGHNMIYSSGDFYFIDFADAIYNSRLLSSRFKKLKDIEGQQMENEILEYIN